MTVGQTYITTAMTGIQVFQLPDRLADGTKVRAIEIQSDGYWLVEDVADRAIRWRVADALLRPV